MNSNNREWPQESSGWRGSNLRISGGNQGTRGKGYQHQGGTDLSGALEIPKGKLPEESNLHKTLVGY